MKPPEQVRAELVGQWLAKADEDYQVAVHLLTEDARFAGAVGFHAQQSAEKYLKAFLTWHQVEFPKTHDLGELLDLAEKADSALATALRETTALNPFGVAARYPGDLAVLTAAEANEAFALATRTRDHIAPLLNACLESSGGGLPQDP
jgi:HEPN domain-containing protein